MYEALASRLNGDRSLSSRNPLRPQACVPQPHPPDPRLPPPTLRPRAWAQTQPNTWYRPAWSPRAPPGDPAARGPLLPLMGEACPPPAQPAHADAHFLGCFKIRGGKILREKPRPRTVLASGPSGPRLPGLERGWGHASVAWGPP